MVQVRIEASYNLLIVFVKTPRAGEVKSRLQHVLGAEGACDLYRAIAGDVIAHLRLHRENFEIEVFFWPPDDRTAIEQWLGDGLPLHPQEGDDLGARMHRAFARGFQKGYRKIVLVGSDIPALDHSVVEAAFRVLEHNDVVLGPSTDGGYYLMGLKAPRRELFTGMEWSTDRVCRETLDRTRRSGLSVSMLGPLADIDTLEDVAQLRNLIEGDSIKTECSYLKRTARVLRSHYGSSAGGGSER